MIISKAFRRCRMVNPQPAYNSFNPTMAPMLGSFMPRTTELFAGVFALRGGRLTEDDWAKWFASVSSSTQLTYQSLSAFIAANRPDITIALTLTGSSGNMRVLFNDNKRVFDFNSWTPSTVVFTDANPLKFDYLYIPIFASAPSTAIGIWNMIELTPADIIANGQPLAMDGTQAVLNTALNISRIEFAMY